MNSWLFFIRLLLRLLIWDRRVRLCIEATKESFRVSIYTKKFILFLSKLWDIVFYRWSKCKAARWVCFFNLVWRLTFIIFLLSNFILFKFVLIDWIVRGGTCSSNSWILFIRLIVWFIAFLHFFIIWLCALIKYWFLFLCFLFWVISWILHYFFHIQCAIKWVNIVLIISGFYTILILFLPSHFCTLWCSLSILLKLVILILRSWSLLLRTINYINWFWVYFYYWFILLLVFRNSIWFLLNCYYWLTQREYLTIYILRQFCILSSLLCFYFLICLS